VTFVLKEGRKACWRKYLKRINITPAVIFGLRELDMDKERIEKLEHG
jgi:hypothetical protein